MQLKNCWSGNMFAPSQMEHYVDTLWLRRMPPPPCGSNEPSIHCFAKCAMVRTSQWRYTRQALQHHVSRKDSKKGSQGLRGPFRIRPLWLSAWLHSVVETVHTWLKNCLKINVIVLHYCTSDNQILSGNFKQVMPFPTSASHWVIQQFLAKDSDKSITLNIMCASF